MKIRAILLFGSPGAGKGTQGKILGRIPNYLHVSSGELFRNLRVQNPLGQLFIDYASHGNLVPDEPTIKLWRDDIENRIRNGQFNPETDTVLLDGIPRNVNQAKLLEDRIYVAGFNLSQHISKSYKWCNGKTTTHVPSLTYCSLWPN